MAEAIENLMPEHLKRFQATLDRVDRRLSELTTRQSDTHAAVHGPRRDQVNDAEVVAHIQVQMDCFQERLERVERRLELSTES